MRPRKRFGQHFLHDRDVVRRIIDAIAPKADDRLVEIGPGRGAITLPLLERVDRLEVVEIDRDLAPKLQARCRGPGTLVVHVADALRFDFRSLATHGKLRLVGNLPYNISTPLLFRLLDQRECISDMHFMLQREVVDRMAAAPGSKKYGRLTVMLAIRCEVTPLFTIGPGAFTPPPKVDSRIVRLVPLDEPPCQIDDPSAFSMLVAQAFTMRRKTIRNALKGLLDDTAIQAAGIDPGLRPENLSPSDFAALASRMAPLSATGAT